MTTPERKRVFILGAGFSKAAGMPDACKLTQLLLDAPVMRDDKEFQDWARDLQDRIRHLNGTDAADEKVTINYEQLFDFAAFDLTLFRMFEKAGSNVRAFDKVQRIEAFLAYMEEDLPAVLIDKQAKADVSKIQKFVNYLRAVDTVATFNYDTLVETSLTASGVTWSHGFYYEPPGNVCVAKLHGSLDWAVAPRGHRSKHGVWTKLFDPSEYWEQKRADNDDSEREALYRVPDIQVAAWVSDPPRRFIGNDVLRPALCGLGSHKPVEQLVGSAVPWRITLRGLHEADEIYVIGWSASPFDTMARFHFAYTIKQRTAAPGRTVVVDPRVHEQINNYRAIFGGVIAVPQKVEETDWGELFGMSTDELRCRYPAASIMDASACLA